MCKNSTKNTRCDLNVHHSDTTPELPFSQPRNDDTASAGRRGSEKKRRVKMADLRNLIETRMFSKSERTLEKIGLENDAVSRCKLLENSVTIDFVSQTKGNFKFSSNFVFNAGVPPQFGYGRSTIDTVSKRAQIKFGQRKKYAKSKVSFIKIFVELLIVSKMFGTKLFDF